MEVWAILQVLILALDAGYLKIIIFSDSRNVLEVINSVSWSIITILFTELNNFYYNWRRTNSLFWIPAHNDILTDKAKEAYSSG